MPAAFTRTRADMEKIIAEGGSVMLPDGRIVTRAADLPDEAALAAGDVDRHQANVDRLQAEHEAKGKELEEAKKSLAKAQQAAPKAEGAKGDAKGEGADADHAKGHGHKAAGR